MFNSNRNIQVVLWKILCYALDHLDSIAVQELVFHLVVLMVLVGMKEIAVWEIHHYIVKARMVIFTVVLMVLTKILRCKFYSYYANVKQIYRLTAPNLSAFATRRCCIHTNSCSIDGTCPSPISFLQQTFNSQATIGWASSARKHLHNFGQ